MRWRWWMTALLALIPLGYVAYQQVFTAGLDVVSDPPGAEVRIDGRRVGVTPFSSPALAPGVHRVEVRHSFYVAVDRRIDLPAGERTRMQVALERGSGRVELYSNPRGAWVEVDGERHEGTTPLLLELPSGPHEIAMGMAERRSADTRVVVVAGELREVRLDLNIDPYGSLRVDTVPAGATVRLPDVDSPYQPGMRLPVGEYRVQVSAPGFETRDVRFEVRYGDNRYAVELPRAHGRLRVTTEPANARVRLRYRDPPGGPLQRVDYRPDMRLPAGTVEVRASALGYRSAYRDVELTAGGADVHLALSPMTVEAGSRLRDPLAGGGQGPELVVIPPGRFTMGSRTGPPSERPVREVTLAEPFALSVYEITVAEYLTFANATGRRADRRLAEVSGDLPVSHVTFDDAQAYAAWLSAGTGHRYRLPSEAEWEYAARGGSTSEYFFGDDPDQLCRYANVGDKSLLTRYRAYGAAGCDDGYVELAPVGAFAPNGFGLYDILGNVAEWVLDCGLPGYADAPTDGTPSVSGNCVTNGVRGGSWDAAAADARVAKRNVASSASGDRGFRVLREL